MIKQMINKWLFCGAAAVFLCACAPTQNAAYKSEFASNKNSPENAAAWCFETLISGDASGFYDACVLKRLKGQAAVVHRLRWERSSKEAALKAEQYGGLRSKEVSCEQNAAHTQANCRIRYELVLRAKTSEIAMPLTFDAASKRWQILY